MSPSQEHSRNRSSSRNLQCPRRLWLEINRPELCEESEAAEAAFQAGEHVGAVARRLYDPKGKGTLIDRETEGVEPALARTRELLPASKPIFEAGFSTGGALAFADVLLPAKRGAWHMIEVKSSTTVKDYQRNDVAIQAFAAREAGVTLSSVKVACIDSGWVYRGDGDYGGLLYETDLTEEAFARSSEVRSWIADAQRVASRPREPKASTGRQCGEPYACGFYEHCSSKEMQPEFPVTWLPRVQKSALKEVIEEGAKDMRDVPDALLNERQQRVKRHTLSGRPFIRRKNAAAVLARYKLPAYFLDFEAIYFAVPIWKGTRPYQQIPFQFSLHHLSRRGELTHRPFIDLSGKDPALSLAKTLIAAAGKSGPIFVYNASYERTRLRELGERFPRLAADLAAIESRTVDLRPIVEEFYYHPNQQGSWRLKAVLPAIAPDLDYQALVGVQDGGMAMAAYLEAIHAETAPSRRAEIERQLLDYCGLDTFALVRIWAFLSGSNATY